MSYNFWKFPQPANVRMELKKSNNITAVAAKSLQSCPTLGDRIEGNPPGSAIPEIIQARTL